MPKANLSSLHNRYLSMCIQICTYIHTYIQTYRRTDVRTHTYIIYIYIWFFSPGLSLSFHSVSVLPTASNKLKCKFKQPLAGPQLKEGALQSSPQGCCVNLVPALCGLYPRHPIRRSFRDFSTFVEVITPWKLSELSSCKGQWLGSKVKGTSNGKRRSFQWGQGDGDCFGMIFAPGSYWKMGVASSLTKISLVRSCSNWFLTVINGQYGL
jgi:hypothetical protein